jgi:lactate dehydrogenase-like 2-hydroxyacid dehydrogenase
VFENEPNIRPEFLELNNAALLPHVTSASATPLHLVLKDKKDK